MNKEENFKEKIKQALTSTIRVISDDYKPNFDKKNEKVSPNYFTVYDISYFCTNT